MGHRPGGPRPNSFSASHSRYRKPVSTAFLASTCSLAKVSARQTESLMPHDFQRSWESAGIVGPTPGPRRTPHPAAGTTASAYYRARVQADEGVGRGPGGPPHRRPATVAFDRGAVFLAVSQAPA